MSHHSCSASGGLKVCSVDSKGYFVKVVNSGDHPEQLNGCSIQQSINDRLIAAFKFPNGVVIDPGQTITVSIMCVFALESHDTLVGVVPKEWHDTQPSTRLCVARQAELVS